LSGAEIIVPATPAPPDPWDWQVFKSGTNNVRVVPIGAALPLLIAPATYIRNQTRSEYSGNYTNYGNEIEFTFTIENDVGDTIIYDTGYGPIQDADGAAISPGERSLQA
jgi:hypothetical protein